jgi:hypothetical protein
MRVGCPIRRSRDQGLLAAPSGISVRCPVRPRHAAPRHPSCAHTSFRRHGLAVAFPGAAPRAARSRNTSTSTISTRHSRVVLDGRFSWQGTRSWMDQSTRTMGRSEQRCVVYTPQPRLSNRLVRYVILLPNGQRAASLRSFMVYFRRSKRL